MKIIVCKSNTVGTIFYSNNAKLNLEKAYEYAIQYMENSSVQHIMANTHPDFMFIEKLDEETQISIDIARRINEFAYKKPVIATKKAIIIHNIEDLSLAASNSLLKTLEEPPTDVEFILTTKCLSSVLPTIKSRCSKVKVFKQYKTYNNVKEFVKNNIVDIPDIICDIFIKYFEGDRTLNSSFAKDNTEHVFDFIDVAMLFLSYKQNFENARKILCLQELKNIARNTYPDKQNLLLSVMYIATHKINLCI